MLRRDLKVLLQTIFAVELGRQVKVCVQEDTFPIHDLMYNAALTCSIFIMSKNEIVLTSDLWRHTVHCPERKLLRQ